MIFALTPTVGWALPLVWPALLSAAGALDYKLFTSTADDAPLRGKLTRELKNLQLVTISLDQVIRDVVAEELGREQVVRFVRGDVTVVFKRDTRGKFSVEVMGPVSMPRPDLERAGEEFARAVVQQFAYNKMAREMELRGASVVGEEVRENGDIVLKLRRWE
jgi:hypothetical protein